MAFVSVLQSGDGLVQRDRYRVDIDCAPGAAAHITTQAATNVFGARQNFATQLVRPRDQAGAVLEYLPDPGVARRGSRLFQRISVTADRDSTLILGQTLLPGRVAHGGAHVYDPYCSETEVRRSDGVLFLDVVRLGSADRHPKSIGLLGEHDVVATLYVISRRTDPITMVEGLRTALESCLDVLDGVSELPNGCGVAVRLLGSTSKAVQTARATAWIAAHLELLGTAAPHLRRGWPGPPVLTPPPPPVRSHSTDVGRDHARLSWRSWKIRMHNVPHNVPVMKRSSSTTPSTMTK